MLVCQKKKSIFGAVDIVGNLPLFCYRWSFFLDDSLLSAKYVINAVLELIMKHVRTSQNSSHEYASSFVIHCIPKTCILCIPT